MGTGLFRVSSLEPFKGKGYTVSHPSSDIPGLAQRRYLARALALLWEDIINKEPRVQKQITRRYLYTLVKHLVKANNSSSSLLSPQLAVVAMEMMWCVEITVASWWLNEEQPVWGWTVFLSFYRRDLYYRCWSQWVVNEGWLVFHKPFLSV
jgi:hypothetical protein